MKIERHKIDEPYMSEMGERAKAQFERLPGLVLSTKKNPKNLDMLIDNARRAAAYGLIVGAPTPKVLEALQLAAKASAALFTATAASPSNPVNVRLDDGPLATYTSPPDESTVHDGRWMIGFYLSIISRDKESLNLLCSTSLDSLRASSTKGAEYQYLYAKSLQDYITLQWNDIVKTMLAAVKATDPKRPDIFDPDWTLYLHVPQLEVLIYVVTKDAKFGEALAKAVRLHKEYWSKQKERRQNHVGFFSLELTGLTKMGLDQGLTFDVESPYIPMELIR